MRGGACTCPPAVLPIGILFAGLWGEAGVHVQQNFRCPWNGICRGTADNDDPKPFIRTLTVEEIVGNVMSVDARNALVDGLPGRPDAVSTAYAVHHSHGPSQRGRMNTPLIRVIQWLVLPLPGAERQTGSIPCAMEYGMRGTALFGPAGRLSVVAVPR
jgi:hypothetical protein